MSYLKPRHRVHQCACAACAAHPYGRVARQHQAINRVVSLLHEKGRRQFAGLLALQCGRGGVARISVITGLSRPTIRRGRDELQRKEYRAERERVRQRGEGRKLVEKTARNLDRLG